VRFARLLTALLLLCGLSACQSQETAVPDSFTAITLSPAAEIPTDLSALGPGEAWELPAGRSVAGGGAYRAGRHLVMPIESVGSSDIQTWVLDTETGLTRRHRPIDHGWTESGPIAAGDWMLRLETQPSEDDYSRWRLYAQRLDSSTPRLLAESSRPGSREALPSWTTDGQQIAWQQGDDFSIYLWEPGEPKATLVAERDQPGLLEFADDGRLFVLETASGAKTLTQIPLPGQKETADVTTFDGVMTFDVVGQTAVYFPEPGDGHGNWVTIPLGGDAGVLNQGEQIKPGLDGPYSAHWITDSVLLSSSASGTTLYDLADPAATVTSASTDLTTPRVSAGSLVIGYQPPDDGPSLVFVKSF
jgi:hypothetical protein